MCGLAGMIGPDIKYDDLKMMKDLLHITSLRGTDSTGLMIAGFHNKNKWVEVEKAPFSSPIFIKRDFMKLAPMLEDYSADLFMAHCRDATVGVINEKNAHPFDLQNIVGAHNGTLVDSRYRQSGKTDSEEMFTDMDTKGILPVLENLSQNSAYAISVFHKGTTKISLARNNKRSLWIGLNLDRKVIYWSSEDEMLKLAAARNHVKLVTYYLAIDTIYTIDWKNITGGDKPQWSTEDVVYKTPAPTKGTTKMKEVWVPTVIDSTETSTTMTTMSDMSGDPMYSESYFDSVFDKVMKGQPVLDSPILTEADFDTDGNPLSHVRLSNPNKGITDLFDKGSPVMDRDGPNYEAEGMWWDEECCLCNRKLLNQKDIDESIHVQVDGIDYYSCKECDQGVEEQVRRNNYKRRPPLEDDEVTTH